MTNRGTDEQGTEKVGKEYRIRNKENKLQKGIINYEL
jgi:hypothetical protein